MGTYTTNLNLYKPASSEFVDPDVQLNRNWDILDPAVKRLMEYEYTTATVPNVVGSVDRARFYKPYSNSISAYLRSGNFFYQDPTAFVSSWVNASSLVGAGEASYPPLPLFYRFIRKTPTAPTTEIEWCGAIWENAATMALNANTTGIMTLPASISPTVAKYFTQYAGDTATFYSVARLSFFPSGDVQYKRYGTSDQTSTAENRIDFSGIKYNLEVAA